MGRQRNRPQMKEQENSPEDLDEMEAIYQIGSLMIIRILNSMKKDIETSKKDQLEIKNIVSEINNTLEEINSRLDEAEDGVSILEDKVGKKHLGRATKRQKRI